MTLFDLRSPSSPNEKGFVVVVCCRNLPVSEFLHGMCFSKLPSIF